MDDIIVLDYSNGKVYIYTLPRLQMYDSETELEQNIDEIIEGIQDNIENYIEELIEEASPL